MGNRLCVIRSTQPGHPTLHIGAVNTKESYKDEQTRYAICHSFTV